MTGASEEVESPGLAQQLATAALAVPGVSDLHSGRFGEIATYLPGQRVSGVSLEDGAGEIHIVVDLTYDLHTVAEMVRDAAERLAGRPVTVMIADIRVDTTSKKGGTQ